MIRCEVGEAAMYDRRAVRVVKVLGPMASVVYLTSRERATVPRAELYLPREPDASWCYAKQLTPGRVPQ